MEYLGRKHQTFAQANGLDGDIPWTSYAPYPPPFIVSHYTFHWKDWTARVLWHVMEPPYDWKRVYLANEKEGIYWAVEFDTNDRPRQIPYEAVYRVDGRD